MSLSMLAIDFGSSLDWILHRWLNGLTVYCVLNQA